MCLWVTYFLKQITYKSYVLVREHISSGGRGGEGGYLHSRMICLFLWGADVLKKYKTWFLWGTYFLNAYNSWLLSWGAHFHKQQQTQITMFARSRFPQSQYRVYFVCEEHFHQHIYKAWVVRGTGILKKHIYKSWLREERNSSKYIKHDVFVWWGTYVLTQMQSTFLRGTQFLNKQMWLFTLFVSNRSPQRHLQHMIVARNRFPQQNQHICFCEEHSSSSK